ncbi:MAG: transporter substrate-binding domain-containing protein [Pseudomonadota bacterium]
MRHDLTIDLDRPRLRLRLCLALCLCLAPLAGRGAEGPSYRLVAGELPPFSTQQGPDSPGVLVEVAQELSRRVGAAPSVEFFPWQRALMMTTNTARIAVLPLTRTPEREADYRWLAKLYWQNFVFISRHGTVDLNNTAALKNRKIVVLRGSPHLKALLDAGFKSVGECSTVSDCMRMLKTGIVDLTYGGEAIHRGVANLAGASEGDFDYSATFRSGEIWLAGSKDFSDAEAAAWQAAMKAMHADGSYARILRKHGMDPDKGSR